MTNLFSSHLPKGRTLAAIAVIAASSLFAQTTQAQAQTKVDFTYKGASESWTVPAGVTSVAITAKGGQGSEGYEDTRNGGLGGEARGVLAVTPGEVLQIYVGRRGTSDNFPNSAGFNGGGHGVSEWNPGGGISIFSGGGGGASDVRQGGNTLAHRKIVAGGGGGGLQLTAGGAGGGLVGGAGSSTVTGGSQSSGGTGDFNGSSGQGGNAGDSTKATGGGGGGYYGGGASKEQSGGGGSSFLDGVTGGQTIAGANSGNGSVSITYTVNPTPVPTLSEWAMIGLSLALAGGAALYIQRRRTLA